MRDERLGERLTDFPVAERIEVTPVEGEGALVGSRAAASPKIDQGNAIGRRPILGLRQTGAVARSAAHQVSWKGKKPTVTLPPHASAIVCILRRTRERSGSDTRGTRASLEARSGRI